MYFINFWTRYLKTAIKVALVLKKISVTIYSITKKLKWPNDEPKCLSYQASKYFLETEGQTDGRTDKIKSEELYKKFKNNYLS